MMVFVGKVDFKEAVVPVFTTPLPANQMAGIIGKAETDLENRVRFAVDW